MQFLVSVLLLMLAFASQGTAGLDLRPPENIPDAVYATRFDAPSFDAILTIAFVSDFAAPWRVEPTPDARPGVFTYARYQAATANQRAQIFRARHWPATFARRL